MSRLWSNAPAERATWAEQARAVRIENELARRGYPFWLRVKHNNVGQPCPMCGGRDRFSVNTRRQVFNCRGCGRKGDVIALVQALNGISYLDAIAHLAGAAPQRTNYSISKQPPAATNQQNEENERQGSISVARPCGQGGGRAPARLRIIISGFAA
jgi:phage/plasmid primase-like uncharacterized protein